ncbi:MAG: ABC transporter permease [Verrucomicrobia bacterium]|nr:ABC transporter permease [Verrucomicrobiota bacterium]
MTEDSGRKRSPAPASGPKGSPEDAGFDIWLEAGRTEKHYWRDLWRYRELFAILAWRDVAVRYKQTVAGAAWALLQPFLTMVIMTFVFGRVAGLPSQGAAPYAILVFAGMLPWQFFASSLSSSSQSLVGNANLISKVYFPRMIVPVSAVVVACIDFLVSFLILAALMLWYRFCPDTRILLLPAFVLLAFLASLGPGLILTALNVRYRDFRFVIPFIVQFGLYVSPVGFSTEVIRNRFGETGVLLYSLNPMVGVIDGFRWAILGGESAIYFPGLVVSLLTVTILLVLGIWYFRKTERTFADVI